MDSNFPQEAEVGDAITTAGRESLSVTDKILAWSVHAFTSMGSVITVFAIIAVMQKEWRAAMGWLFVALVIDSVDGTLSRAVRVKKVLPDFDGRMLDYVIDFLNFVIIPALFIYEARLVPDSLRVPCLVMILYASCYHYGNLKAVTADYYFKGFPAMWNMIAFYIFITGLSPWWSMALVALACILHFVPIKFIHVTRTVKFRGLTVPLVMLGGIIDVKLLLDYPSVNSWLLAISLLVIGYLLVMSIYLTFATRNYSWPTDANQLGNQV